MAAEVGFINENNVKNCLIAIMDALSGSDCNYYGSTSITGIGGDRAKYKVRMTVVFPAGKKQDTVTQIDKLSLSGWPVNWESEPNPKWLDVALDKTVKTKYIRITLKEESVPKTFEKPSGENKGSGGGATQTAIVESAQCLYCALAFNVFGRNIKEDELISTENFEEAQKSIEIGSNVTLDKMLGIAKAWRKSSILGANKLYDTIKPSKGEYRFYRGAGIDDTINKAYNNIKQDTVVAGSESIKDKVPATEDKWNPADIWIAKTNFDSNQIVEKSKTKKVLTFNKFLVDQFTSNNLIGVSLKKITGDAHIEPMNKTADRKIDKVGYGGATFNYKSLDTYIDFKSGSNTSIQFRNFSGSRGSWQGEVGIKGSSAKHGKIGSGAIWEILKSHGINPFNGISFYQNDNQQFYVNCGKDDLKTDIAKHIYELLKKVPAANYKVSTTNKEGEITRLVYMEPEEKDKPAKPNHPQRWMYSKFLGLTLINAIKNHTDKDEIVKDIYLYASSQHSLSGVYYKLT